MRTEARPNIRARCALSAALAASLAALALAPPNAAASGLDPEPGPSGAPQLSIAVENGKDAVEEGDTLSYEITVENLGTEKVADLQVSQTMPLGLAFASADRHGAVDDDTVRWTVDLDAGDHATLRSKMKVTTPPDDALRLATVACASESALDPPIVCASHLDALPAAEADARRAESGAAATASSNSLRWLTVAVVAALLLGGLVMLTMRGRRRRRTPSGQQ